ncbi:MAG: glycosyltransferase family 4 protein [Thermosphaera sp.]
MTSRKNLLVVSDVSIPGMPPSGGSTRSTKSIIEYSKYYDVDLIVPRVVEWSRTKLKEVTSTFNIRKILHFSIKGKPVNMLHERFSSLLYVCFPEKIHKLFVRIEQSGNVPNAIIVLNEPASHIYVGNILIEKFEAPSMLMLQLPVFYCRKERREQIARALIIWYRNLYGDNFLNEISRSIFGMLDLECSHSKKLRNTLRKYDLLVSVSKSIPLEMGDEWVGKIHALNPGVSLYQEDLELVNSIKSSTREKKNHIVFGGRPDALKGLIEGLYAFKKISRARPDVKLIVTGHISDKLRRRVERLLHRLGISEKVILTGSISRAERLRAVAEAKLMIYPSHVDSFSYAVLESLYLGTPVVAYDIPALRIHYGGNPSVRLVEEGDLETLITDSIEVLESKLVDISPPTLRPWSDIISEELSLIRKLVGG